MQIVDHDDQGVESGWSINVAYSHNQTKLIPTKSMPQSPPSYSKLRKTPNATSSGYPVNFWLKQLVTKNDEPDSKMLLETVDKSSLGAGKDEFGGNLDKVNDGFGPQLPDEVSKQILTVLLA